MKVLHFIQKFPTDSGYSFGYLPELIKDMAGKADVYVVAERPLDSTLYANVKGQYRYSSSIPCANDHKFAKILKETQPDIVHIHACWSLSAYMFMRKCHKRHIPVVLSTGKQLMPWHFMRSYIFCRLPKFLAFQRKMTRCANALHASNEQEASWIETISWNPRKKSDTTVNDRIAIIADSRIEKLTTGEVTNRFFTLYRKVADTYPFLAMSENERTAEDALLTAGLSEDKLSAILQDKHIKAISTLNDLRLRAILLHATDEGIIDYIYSGARQCNLRLPAFDYGSIERFNISTAKFDDTRCKSFIARHIDSDSSLSDTEKNICREIVTDIHKSRQRCLHRSDMARLYSLLRFKDYDEVRLNHKIKKLHIAAMASRLLQILCERYSLTEGYMFAPPLDDRKTRRLKTELFASSVQ
ncbi:MAG: hypothetical protein Q4D41_07440 [Prevotellaceae bacterium]|nr:hypothetical protein [Prevotellaceae bacterium]